MQSGRVAESAPSYDLTMFPGSPLLVELLPALAREIEHGLNEARRPELAGQVGSLRVFELCGCDDLFCSSFYTSAKAERPWGGFVETLMPPVESGLVLLDVADGTVRYVEVIDRDDFKTALAAHGANP